MRLTGFSRYILLVCLSLPCADGIAQPSGPDVELTQSNFVAWRDFVLPDAAELGFMEIPWLPTFKQAVLAADRDNKPVLLWTMNGHPLGCT